MPRDTSRSGQRGKRSKDIPVYVDQLLVRYHDQLADAEQDQLKAALISLINQARDAILTNAKPSFDNPCPTARFTADAGCNLDQTVTVGEIEINVIAFSRTITVKTLNAFEEHDGDGPDDNGPPPPQGGHRALGDGMQISGDDLARIVCSEILAALFDSIGRRMTAPRPPRPGPLATLDNQDAFREFAKLRALSRAGIAGRERNATLAVRRAYRPHMETRQLSGRRRSN